MPAGRILLHVASIGAIALVARSIAIGPVPLWIAAIAIHLYLAIILCGVFFLRLGMFVDVLWRGPDGARGVALTFDDGPSPSSTPRILDMLDAAKVKATFFVIGKKAEAHPDLVRDIVRRGHAIAMHSHAHPASSPSKARATSGTISPARSTSSPRSPASAPSSSAPRSATRTPRSRAS